MASQYPTSLDTLASSYDDNTQQAIVHALHHNDLADAINKIEAELGTNPSGSVTTVKARLDALTASGERFDVHDYGAIGDGITNDTTAWQSAITAAGAAAGTTNVAVVHGRGGYTYKIVGTGTPIITIPSGVIIDLHESTIDAQTVGGASGSTLLIPWVFGAVGTEKVSTDPTGYQLLTQDAAQFTNFVMVASGTESQFQDADWIRIASNATIDGQSKVGEILQVDYPSMAIQAMTANQTTLTTGVTVGNKFPDSKAGAGVLQIENEKVQYTSWNLSGGNTVFTGLTRGFAGTTAATHPFMAVATLVPDPGEVWLKWPTSGSPYLTSDVAFISKITPVERVGLRNGRMKGGGFNKSPIGIRFRLAVDAHVHNMRFDKVEAQAISFTDVVGASAQANHIYQSRLAVGSTNLGYGIHVAGSTQDLTAANNLMRSCRHGVSHGASTFGFPRRCWYIGNHILDSSGASIDAHPPTDGVFFLGNVIVDGGISFLAPFMHAIGNVFIRPGNAILGQNGTTFPTRWQVHDNVVLFPSDIGMAFSGSGSFTPEIQYLSVSNNVIHEPTKSGITIAFNNPSSPPFTWHNLKVTGNMIRNIPSTGGFFGIQVTNCDSGVISANVMSGIGANARGISLNVVQKMTVNGNSMVFPIAGTGKGIELIASDDNVILANVVTLAGTGIGLDATSDKNVLMGNNVRGCTTPITDAGTGNIKSTADASGAYNVTT